jgi:hypothetical protein
MVLNTNQLEPQKPIQVHFVKLFKNHLDGLIIETKDLPMLEYLPLVNIHRSYFISI